MGTAQSDSGNSTLLRSTIVTEVYRLFITVVQSLLIVHHIYSCLIPLQYLVEQRQCRSGTRTISAYANDASLRKVCFSFSAVSQVK